MRFILIPIILLLPLTRIYADDFRKWTEAESKRQIEAKIVDKKLDDSEAKLLMRNGKAIWMSKDRLIPEDQKYIEIRIKPVDHISARVVGSGKGRKKVEVTAVAGSRPLVVKAFWKDSGKQPKGYPKVYKLKKGEEKTFTYEASNEYIVRGWSGKDLVDEEGWNTKTGL
ncbi:MAG: hypothetical protein ACO3SO_09650 [Luteolibacter sp.]